MFGRRNNYKIVLIVVALCLWDVVALHNRKVMSVDGCQTVGCKVCFNPEVCLLCDADNHFQAEPI